MKYLIFAILLTSSSSLSFAQAGSNATDIVFGQSFIPDYTFTGSSLKGSHIVGEAEWRAQNGELIGRAKPGAEGGWLFLDSAYQDIGFHSLFSLTENNESGVLFRIQKTAEGLSGVLLSIKKGEVAPFQVTLDAQGKVLTREKLRYAGGIYYRLAPPENKNDTTGRRGGNFPPRTNPDVKLPVTRPNTDVRTTGWNQLEVFLELNVIRTFLNDGSEIGGR